VLVPKSIPKTAPSSNGTLASEELESSHLLVSFSDSIKTKLFVVAVVVLILTVVTGLTSERDEPFFQFGLLSVKQS
jgi:hypothetical protein